MPHRTTPNPQNTKILLASLRLVVLALKFHKTTLRQPIAESTLKEPSDAC